MADQQLAQAGADSGTEPVTPPAGPPAAGAETGAPPAAAATTEPGAAAAEGGAPTNAAPEAAADCAVTAEGAPIRIPVLANDRDPDGDTLAPELTAPPEHGQATVNPDGTITYTPSGESLRDAFTYEASDGAGGTDDARVLVLVNPTDGGRPEAGQPAVLAGADPGTLSALAEACADATALDVVALEGANVVVAPPEPGRLTRVEVEPGQEIALRGAEFVDARYFVADGGLLVVLPDGRVVFLAGFVEAARGDDPPVLATAGGPPVAGDEVLARLAEGEEPGEVAVGPEHGGGAGFTPYDPGAIGPGLDPLGPLGPTALAYGLPAVELVEEPAGGDGEDDDNGNGGEPPGGALRPLARDDFDATDEDTPVRVEVLGNDTVVPKDAPAGQAVALADDGRPLEIVGFTQATNGTVALNPDGTFTYTPAAEFNGSDAFTYTVADADGDTDTATVTIEVGPVNDAPRVEGTTARTAPVGDVAGATGEGFDYASGFPFPELAEGRAVPLSDLRPVDPANLALPQARDAEVTFVAEGSAQQSVLGVYLIDAAGFIIEPRIVFENVANLQTGATVALSEVYDPATLQAGTEFAFFLVANGAALNPDVDFGQGDFQFLLNGEPAKFTDDAPLDLQYTAPSGEQRFVEGDIFHTRDDSPETPLHNSQNEGEMIQAISGLEPGVAGLTIGFEGQRFDDGDRDFNDTVFRVKVPLATDRSIVGGPATVADDLTVTDVDDTDLVRATVEITSGERPGDALGLAGLQVGPGGVIAGTNIRVVDGGDGDGRLVFEGRDEIATYEAVLRAVTFDNPEPGDGVRQISFVVEDPGGAESNVLTVALDVGAAPEGTAGNDTLFGTDDDDVLDGAGGDDVVNGGDGADQLFGGDGDDELFGSLGADRLEGGAGADDYVYRSLDDRGDRITGFDAAEGDELVLGDLLKGFDPRGSDLGDFLKLEATGGGDIVVSVDADGPGNSFAPIELVTLVQPAGVSTAEDLVNNGAVAA